MSRTLLSLVVLAAVLVSQAQAQTTRTKAVDQGAAKPAVQVNLNTATVADLQGLPGVGAKVAARIVEYRQKQGSTYSSQLAPQRATVWSPRKVHSSAGFKYSSTMN